MNPSSFADIIAALDQGTVIPYLGPGVLRGVTDTVSGTPIPAESQDLILAMTGGQPMAPRLMYEFPRAAMHMENKKGRSFLERFLNTTYGERTWSASEFHQWLAARKLPYVIDCNRDTQLQQLYADRDHTLVLGASRLTGTHFRFDLHEFRDGAYRHITQNEVNKDLPVLFKPMGSPLPKPSYVASDADFVDYITELMGGFAVPTWLKQYRQQKRYLFLGLRFNRDTERMVMSDLIYDAADHAGWAFIPEPNAKEARFCARRNIQIVQADWTDLLAGTAPVASQVA